ncbi:MAG: glycosyltransferase family 2 protein [Thermoplasmata archaeon]|nr:glycosyltransferase family 2 protein [Thermoplasmata archaeon]
MSSAHEESTPRAGELSGADAASFDGADVVVVLPTLNEQDGLARTLQEIPLEPMQASGWTVRRLVVDGGSTDGTLQVARQWSVPVLRQAGRGKGAAIREALNWLAARHVRFVVVLDADCTYPGSMVPAMAQLLDAGSQLVVGVRQAATSARDDYREFIHRVGNRLLNLTASQLAGLPILDLCSGFWAVDVRAVAQLDLVTNGFEIEAELFTKCYRAGFTVTQIPISYRERVGVAKLNAVRDGASILLTTIRFGRRRLTAAFHPPPPSQLRDFLSIAMVHNADDFLLITHPSRRDEAERIAQRIRASRPGARVEVKTAPSGAVIAPTPSGPGSTHRQALTISLPGPVARPSAPTTSAMIHLPSTGRLITIKADASDPSPRPADLFKSGGFVSTGNGYRLEYARDHWPVLGRVRALMANTFPSEQAKELAFLGANGHYGTLAVWRRHGGSTEVPALAMPASAAPTNSGPVLGEDSLP